MENLTPDFLVKSAWVSAALALILTLPALGVFISIYQTTGNIVVGAILGFGLHFGLISISSKISSMLSKMFED